jgi:protein-disulfide isomerase
VIQAQTKSNLIIALAIVVAAALVAGSVIYSGIGSVVMREEGNGALDAMRPVSSRDHIRGDADAPVKIVEYSDTACPFCKRFHESMRQIMNEYDGKVAWVYRHSPIDALHPQARKEAEATECAAELGGNDVFWNFVDRIYEVTPTNRALPVEELPRIAEHVGLDVEKFDECLASGRHAATVEADARNSKETGANGTPWSIIVAEDGSKYPLSGAQPLPSIRRVIDLALEPR